MNKKKSIKDSIKSLSFQEAEELFYNYEYCLIYEISDVVLNRLERLCEIDWNEVQEAWLFDEKGQLHIYRDEGILLAARVDDAVLDHAHTLEKTYRLADTNKFRIDGNKMIIVKEYIDFDEDGQSYVAYTRLLRLA